jgi:hypothetical protein
MSRRTPRNARRSRSAAQGRADRRKARREQSHPFRQNLDRVDCEGISMRRCATVRRPSLPMTSTCCAASTNLVDL